MAEKADDTADELKDIVYKADGETEEGETDGLAASSGSESGSQVKRQRLQTPSPRPVPFMVQRKSMAEYLVRYLQ